MSSLITDDLFATPSENSVKRKPGEFKLIAPDAAVELEFDASKLKSKRFAKISDDVFDLIETGKVFLAGGALRTLIDPDDEVCDYDLYFKNLDDVDLIKNILEEDKQYNLYYQCPEGKLFCYKTSDDCGNSTKIQLICEKAFENPANCIREFDFGACAAAYDGEKVYCFDMFVNNVRSKIITLLSLPYPLATFKRAAKYAAKGYNIGYFAEQYIWEVMSMTPGDLVEGNGMRRYID